MGERGSVPDPLREARRRIEWLLSSPGTSDWLKTALRDALREEEVDPVVLLNDLELLDQVLRPWIHARIDRSLGDGSV